MKSIHPIRILPCAALFFMCGSIDLPPSSNDVDIQHSIGSWMRIDSTQLTVEIGRFIDTIGYRFDTTRFTISQDSLVHDSAMAILDSAHLRVTYHQTISRGMIVGDSTYSDNVLRQIVLVNMMEKPDSILPELFRVDYLVGDTLKLARIEHDPLLHLAGSGVTKQNETAKVLRQYLLWKMK
jgi:hypothetical protein